MQKSARRAARKSIRRSDSPKPARVARRKQALEPTIKRIKRDIELVAPRGCRASVLLKLVDHDDRHRYYSWWAMAGRHDMDKVAVKYKFTGEDTIRVDLPEGMPLSAEAVLPHLTQFLARQPDEGGDPPIIIR